MFVLLPLFTLVYYLCFYTLFYAGIKSRLFFWSLFLVALVSPPLALLIYIVLRQPGHKKLRDQLGHEVKAFSDPTSVAYQKYVSASTPYTSVANFSATVFVPLRQSYVISYFCSVGTLALAASCAACTLTAVEFFI